MAQRHDPPLRSLIYDKAREIDHVMRIELAVEPQQIVLGQAESLMGGFEPILRCGLCQLER